MKEFWNERYKASSYAYGEAPNVYFEKCLAQLPAGKILLPADGEGRNGVYAATKGWQVDAFDISEEGQSKATALALNKNVSIHYSIADVNTIHLENEHYDAIALIYAHFHENDRNRLHQKLNASLKVGGHVILEAFSKNNLEYVAKNPKVGGPKDVSMLYSIEDLQSDFPNYKWIELDETVVNLEEGEYHVGQGSVIRFLGQKL